MHGGEEDGRLSLPCTMGDSRLVHGAYTLAITYKVTNEKKKETKNNSPGYLSQDFCLDPTTRPHMPPFKTLLAFEAGVSYLETRKKLG